MNSTTLQALRRFLFFTQPEAATLIGNVSERSWRFWEEGNRTIPSDVIEKMGHLCEWRNSAIHAAKSQIHASPDGAEIVLIWYATLEDWCSLPGRDALLWRPQCSVIAELCAVFSAVVVPFDSTNYFAWLGKRADSEKMRSQWAGQVA